MLQTQKMYSWKCWPNVSAIIACFAIGIPSICFIQWTLLLFYFSLSVFSFLGIPVSSGLWSIWPSIEMKRKYFDKYILTGYWDEKKSLGNGSVVYAPLLCPMHKNRCIVSLKNIITFVLENFHVGQIYFVFGTNIFCILDKYILYFRQNYFVFWTNIFWNFGQIYFEIWKGWDNNGSRDSSKLSDASPRELSH